MKTELAFKNLKNLITRSPLAFLVIMLIEILGTVGIIMTYGIVRNVFTEQQKESSTSRRMNLWRWREEDDGSGEVVPWEDTEDFCRKLGKLLDEECAGLLNSAEVYGSITVDGKKYSVGCTKLFHKDEESKWDDRIYEMFERGENVVFVYTRSYPCRLGDVININGRDYKVVRADDGDEETRVLAQDFYFPYDAMPSGMKFHEMTLWFKDIPTHKQADTIAEKIKEYFGAEFPINMPEIPDLLVQQFNSAMLACCAVVALMIAFNCITVYMYIIRRRSDWIAAVRLCGCGNGSLMYIIGAEMLTVACAAFGIGALISHKLIIPKMSEFYPLFDQFYTGEAVGYLFLGYIGSFLLMTVGQLSAFVHRSVDRMRKEGL